MKNIILSVIMGLALLGLSIYFFEGISTTKDRKKANRPNQTKADSLVVPTLIVEKVMNKDIPVSLDFSGSLLAKDRMELYAEVQGVMNRGRKEFKTGVRYSKGETLVDINSVEYQASLQAQKSAFLSTLTSIMPDIRLDFPEAYPGWDKYLTDFDLDKPIAEIPEPSSNKEKLFLAGRNLYTNFYNVKNQEIKLAKYRLRAPFNGVLTEANVTEGTLIRVGQKLGEFVNSDRFELALSVTAELVGSFDIGYLVKVTDPQSQQQWEGKVIRINSKLDQSSQTVKVFVGLNGAGLKEGMYLNAEIVIAPIPNAYQISRSLLLQNNEIFVVANGVLQKRIVDVAFEGQDYVILTGIKDGTIVLAKQTPGIYADMKVEIIEKTK